MSVKTLTKTSVIPLFNVVPVPVLHKSAEYLETRDLIISFARASKGLNRDLLNLRTSAQLLKGCAIREYPKLARDLPFLLAQEYPNLTEDERLSGRNVVRLFWKIDSYIKKGFFLPTHVRTNPHIHRHLHKHPQRIAFHGSAMFKIDSINQISRVDIRCTENQPLNFQGLKDISFLAFPDCVGSGAMAASDKYVAVNRITEQPNVQVDQPSGGKKTSVGRSQVVFFDSTTGKCAGAVNYKPAVSALCFDQNGDLITGDYRNGVCRVKVEPSTKKEEGDSTLPKMDIVQQEIIIKCSPQKTAITALTATPEEILIGDETGGVIRYNLAKQIKKEVRWGSTTQGSSDAVTKIVVKPSGELMVLTQGGRYLLEISGASTVSVPTPRHDKNNATHHSNKDFCLSDKWMLMAVEPKLRVSRPFDFTTTSSLADAPDVVPYLQSTFDPLYCDGARFVHSFTPDRFNPAVGSQIRIWDFSVDVNKILTKLETALTETPDTETAKYLKDFKARVAKDNGDSKDNGDHKKN